MKDTLLSYSLVCTNSENSTVIYGKTCRVRTVDVFSVNNAPVYVKLYDQNTLPTSADTPKIRRGCPAAATAANGAGNNKAYGGGIVFEKGLAIRVVKGLADNDTTAVDANTVLVEVTYERVFV